jgi:hypothetical protein
MIFTTGLLFIPCSLLNIHLLSFLASSEMKFFVQEDSSCVWS